jgi:hypothetical protein
MHAAMCQAFIHKSLRSRNAAHCRTTLAIALNVTLECSDLSGIDAAQAMFPEADDNCDPEVSDLMKISGAFQAGACPEEGTYTNTWTVIDACSNLSAVYTQVITITDNTAPAWVTPAGALDLTLQCSDLAGIEDALLIFPEATDNCGADVSGIIKTSGSFVPGSCPEEGTYTNSWVVSDNCGNISASYIQVITIIDNTAPVWNTIPGALDLTLQCSDAAGIEDAQLCFLKQSMIAMEMFDIVKTSCFCS